MAQSLCLTSAICSSTCIGREETEDPNLNQERFCFEISFSEKSYSAMCFVSDIHTFSSLLILLLRVKESVL